MAERGDETGRGPACLERRIGTITPKVLTQRLRQLERDGLVVRTYHLGAVEQARRAYDAA